MSEQKSVAEIKAVLRETEKDLILQREAVRQFVGTEHTTEITKEYLDAARETEAQLGSIFADIMEIGAGDEVEANRLGQQCRDLERYTDAINRMLDTDHAKRKNEEDAKKVDVVKNTGLIIASAAGAVSIVHNGAGNGEITPNEALGAGIAFGVGVVFHKSFLKAFKAAGQVICCTENRVAVLYAQEMLKEGAHEVSRALRIEVLNLRIGTSMMVDDLKRGLRISRQRNEELTP